ncbi:MAG: serine hydroxymethyltransferase [Elusimicrobia bacterium]|jgi:glycine hydroxymethyltransferase|nr:serine hydroxymethyltransferase [Elusimicrobiota bacterium]
MSLKKTDTEIYKAIQNEIDRQHKNLEMIASENYTSPEVLEAMGSPLTDKYAEGYPGRRYYGGCENVDIVENIAIERAKEIFKCEHVNVQPHSGSQANIASYLALLDIGDKIMGMDLSCGGHLTHGHPLNFSGKYFDIVPYGVDKKSHRIDYEKVREIALKERPDLIVCGASAYPREIDFKKFKEIADECDAYLMADIAHIAGLVAKGLHPDPVPYCDVVTTTTHKTLRGPRGGMIMCKKEYASAIDRSVFPGNQGGPLMHVIAAKAVCFKEVLSEDFKDYAKQVIANCRALAGELKNRGIKLISGGTDNHLVLVDLRPLEITGKKAEAALQAAGIVVNKNSIPYDPAKPLVTSGIRIGTPVLTTRGFKEEGIKTVAGLIARVIKDPSEEIISDVNGKVRELCKKYPHNKGRE